MSECCIYEKLKHGGFPRRFLPLIPGKPLTKALGVALTVLDNQRPLYISGPVGQGKTLTLIALAYELVQRSTSVLFIHCGELAEYLRAHNDQIDKYRVLAQDVQHLFLDDVGMESDKSGWWSSWIGNVVNHRYNNLRPTSATTNQKATLLEARLIRRLTEGAMIVEIK